MMILSELTFLRILDLRVVIGEEMKIKLLYWVGLMILVFLCLTVTAFAVDSPVGVVYWGDIQDLGDFTTAQRSFGIMQVDINPNERYTVFMR
jgi:hypothetical protein